MSINLRLDMLRQIKNELRKAIKACGIHVPEDLPFEFYSNKIRLINAIIDTTPPILVSFSITATEEGTAIISGQTEAGLLSTVLVGPDGNEVDISVTETGVISGILTELLDGDYTLTLMDNAGNEKSVIRQITYTVPGVNPIESIFDTGATGLWLDPNDFSTMFQDSDGTIPVTAVGQKVGKMLFKNDRTKFLTQPTVDYRPQLLLDEETGTHYIDFIYHAGTPKCFNGAVFSRSSFLTRTDFYAIKNKYANTERYSLNTSNHLFFAFPNTSSYQVGVIYSTAVGGSSFTTPYITAESASYPLPLVICAEVGQNFEMPTRLQINDSVYNGSNGNQYASLGSSSYGFNTSSASIGTLTYKSANYRLYGMCTLTQAVTPEQRSAVIDYYKTLTGVS